VKTTSPSLGDIANAVLRNQLAALQENEPGARVGEDPEAVHRMRVATRRLRAALRVFAPPDADELRAELAWLAQALGAVRDLDVQMESIQHIALPGEAIEPILERMATAREQARAKLLITLDDQRFRALCDALNRLTLEDDTPALAAAPGYVQTSMKRFRKAATRTGTHAAPVDLHRARIRSKQLRYTLEFVAELYGKRADRLIRRVTAVQDVLGQIQDSYTMQHRLDDMRAELPPTSMLVIDRLQQAYGQQAEQARSEVKNTIRRVLGRRWCRLERRMLKRRPRPRPAHQESQLRPFHTAVNAA